MNIASRGDILKVQKTSSYSPDLSYLRKAPQLFAGKLANPNLQTRDVPREPPRELPDVAAITQRRREERLARMADQEARMADKGTPYALSAKKLFKSNIFLKLTDLMKRCAVLTKTQVDSIPFIHPLSHLFPSYNSLTLSVDLFPSHIPLRLKSQTISSHLWHSKGGSNVVFVKVELVNP